MKNKLIYLSLLSLVFISGCIKSYHDPDSDPVNNNYPLGIFTGKFMRIHKNTLTSKYDTVTANLKLVLSTNTGYSVSGDTTVYHAGSYGSFSEDFVNMEFNDVTSPVNYTTKKTHLSGYYTYKYNGSYLEIVNGVKSDTLMCSYHLTKMK
ncbi:hypothetical protein [Mucilaginibacter sp. UR6-11]|uniref:hypothetical protein n=1 Tax=Mucilaginibacter sp. UR6-11 TaxID=1435644 RepID=UPI001E657D74|nr:hypothetical protein [Mucilaginibacter sp. UR6-11]MCC8423841.1 hypothetical protein [Mucilaginibacter sp. UR6-11]